MSVFSKLFVGNTAAAPEKKPSAGAAQIPTALELTTGNVAGTLYTKVKDVKGKRLYFVEYTPDPMADSSVWKRIDTCKCNCTIPGLESGKKFWVRVGVIASNDEKLWGDAILSPYIP